MNKFQVEYINNIRKSAYIIARSLDKSIFEIHDGSRLGPVELKKFLSQPRAIKKDGTPDMDLYIFSPKDRSQLKMISIGDILELIEK